MLTLRVLCVVLAVVGSKGEAETHDAHSTIYRETIASGPDLLARHDLGKALTSGLHHGPGHYGPIHSNEVIHHGGGLAHGGPVVHGGGVHDIVHGGVIHGGAVHGGGAIHGADVHGGAVHGADIYDGAVHGSVVHGGAVHGAGIHGGGVYGGPVVRKTSVVHKGPIIHGGSVHGGVVRTKVVPVVKDVPVVVKKVTVPVPVHAPAYVPVQPVLSQYHKEDGLGGYSFGYNAGTSSRDETRDPYGNVHGSFSYIDDKGKLQTQYYTAGYGGFRVKGTNLPVHVQKQRYKRSEGTNRHKRSYAIFPAATEPLYGKVSYGKKDSNTVTRVVDGPVEVNRYVEYNHDGPHAVRGKSGYGGYNNIGYGNSGYGNPYGYVAPVSPVFSYGAAPYYGNAGVSYGIGPGPYSLPLYGYGH